MMEIMLTIKDYAAERVKDPFGILSGGRVEFRLELDVPEDDELYSEHGVYAKIVFKDDGEKSGILTCDLYERVTERFVDIELEEEELASLALYCKEHLPQ